MVETSFFLMINSKTRATLGIATLLLLDTIRRNRYPDANIFTHRQSKRIFHPVKEEKIIVKMSEHLRLQIKY